MLKAKQKPSIRFVRTATFSSGYRYFHPAKSLEENRAMYGSLYREKGFGHNFLLEAHIEGSIDLLTGMIINLIEVDQWLKEITTPLDHRMLNDVSAFSGVSPTPERIAQHCFNELALRVNAHPSGARLAKVRLYEGDHAWVDCFGL